MCCHFAIDHLPLTPLYGFKKQKRMCVTSLSVPNAFKKTHIHYIGCPKKLEYEIP